MKKQYIPFDRARENFTNIREGVLCRDSFGYSTGAPENGTQFISSSLENYNPLTGDDVGFDVSKLDNYSDYRIPPVISKFDRPSIIFPTDKPFSFKPVSRYVRIVDGNDN